MIDLTGKVALITGGSRGIGRACAERLAEAGAYIAINYVSSVEQAQEAVAGAHESYIQSLYAHNLSKVELAHAIGDAEDGVKRFLKGNQ